MAIVDVLIKNKPQKQERPKEKKIIKPEKKMVDKEQLIPASGNGAILAKDYLEAFDEIMKEKDQLLAEGKPLIIDGVKVRPDYTPLDLIFNRVKLKKRG